MGYFPILINIRVFFEREERRTSATTADDDDEWVFARVRVYASLFNFTSSARSVTIVFDPINPGTEISHTASIKFPLHLFCHLERGER